MVFGPQQIFGFAVIALGILWLAGFLFLMRVCRRNKTQEKANNMQCMVCKQRKGRPLWQAQQAGINMREFAGLPADAWVCDPCLDIGLLWYRLWCLKKARGY